VLLWPAGQGAAHLDTRLSGGVEGRAAARWGGWAPSAKAKQKQTQRNETKGKGNKKTKQQNVSFNAYFNVPVVSFNYQLCLSLHRCFLTQI